jgi:hypothetical protein
MGNRDEFNAAFVAMRPAVLERDGNCCVKCKSTLALEVHHIEGYAHNEPKLLATLCYLCHGVAPMGEEPFRQWLVIGETGADVIRKRLLAAGVPRMKREDIEKFCGILIEFGLDTNNLKLKTAREKMRNSGLKCEGRKSYGVKPGEAEVIEKMKELCARGKNPKIIARELNIAGIPTRGTKYGKKPWHPSSVAKILTREGIIKAKPSQLDLIPKKAQEDNLNSDAASDDEFWRDIEREVAQGPLKKEMPKKKRIEYTFKPTDNGDVWIPIMMHGAELRQVENVEKIA